MTREITTSRKAFLASAASERLGGCFSFWSHGAIVVVSHGVLVSMSRQVALRIELGVVLRLAHDAERHAVGWLLNGGLVVTHGGGLAQAIWDSAVHLHRLL